MKIDLWIYSILSYKIMKLFHCADIQLRPLTRHKEFKSVFKKFYNSLLENNADKNSIIVICGDIVQEKDKLKPETIMILRRFFKKLVDISGCVVVICGNHDTIEYNKERLDNLTPILDDIDGIYYLKYSGEYVINKVKFVVNSIIDNKFIYNVKKSKYPIVGLYHGMINNCKLDNGIVIKNKVGIKDFKEYNYVLLGDIHKHQYLAPNIAYSGSLVQQNFGEPYDGHGYIIWDLQKNKSKFVEIKSDYGFFNVYNTKDINKIKCPYAYVRYHVDDESKVEKLKKKVEGRCQVLREEVRIVNGNLVNNVELDIIEQCQFDDIAILKNYTNDKKIIKYHKKLKNELDATNEFDSYGYWTIKYLEFKNMLIYGGNVVNKVYFNNGVISVCGDNAIGKSCILKLIIFALFDKTCSNDKNSIIHKNEKDCYIKLDFEFSGNNGNKYSIKRDGKLYKNKNKVEIQFKNILFENNQIINLEHGKKTMEYLRDFLGGYEDFIMTNVFSHSYNISLLNITDQARLKIFIKYFKLDMYQKLFDLAKKDIKDLNKEVSFLLGSLVDKDDIDENNVKVLEKEILKLKKKVNKVEVVNETIISEERYNKIKNDKVIKTSENITLEQIIILKNKLGNFNDEWNKEDQKNLKLLSNFDFNNVKTFDNDIQVPYNDIKKLQDDINKYNIDLFKVDFINDDIKILKEQLIENYNSIYNDNELNDLWDSKFEILNYDMVKDFNLMKQKFNHDYDILKNKNKIISKFLQDKIINDDLIMVMTNEVNGVYDEIKEKIFKSGGYLENNDYINFIKWYELNQKKIKYNNLVEKYGSISELENKIKVLEMYEEYNKLILYYDFMIYKKYIQYCELKDKKEKVDLKNKIEKLECCLKYIQIRDYEKLCDQKKIYDMEIKVEEYKKIIQTKNKINSINQKIKIIEEYKVIVDKGGMPKDILTNNITNIIKLINQFLIGFVGFKINIVIDDSKFELSVIKNNIVLGIGDLSGYETFILNLAFKFSLLKLSCVNKCGCLFIDEGLDCIDSSNFDKLNYVFDDLKTVFKQVLVITHIEDIRKFEDYTIGINRHQDGYSMII